MCEWFVCKDGCALRMCNAHRGQKRESVSRIGVGKGCDAIWVLDYNLDLLQEQSTFLTTGPSPATWALLIVFAEYSKL